MNILAIDTTTKNASVALLQENAEKDHYIEHHISNEITHSEKLLPLIDKTLKEATISLKDIDRFACLLGPGSFTGIRIGLATLKAFAQVEEKEIFAMSSLEGIAYATYIQSSLSQDSKTAYVASIMDAKNDRVYYSLFKICKTLNDKVLISPLLGNANAPIGQALDNISLVLKELQEEIMIDSNTLLFAGNGACLHANLLQEKMKVFALLVSNIIDIYPTPKQVIEAMKQLKEIQPYLYDAYTLDAIYARLSQAERMKYEKDS